MDYYLRKSIEGEKDKMKKIEELKERKEKEVLFSKFVANKTGELRSRIDSQ